MTAPFSLRQVHLVVAGGPDQGKIIPVTVSPFRIGRSPGCDFRPGYPTVSNHHCVISLCNGSILIEDTESCSGTFVNRARIFGPRELQHGDQLLIGQLVLIVQIEGASPGA